MRFLGLKIFRDIRRLYIVTLWYIIAFSGSVIMDRILAVPLTKLLCRWGLRDTFINSFEDADIGVYIWVMIALAVATLFTLFCVPIHCGLVMITLLVMTRLRRRLINLSVRCCYASCGWLFAVSVAFIASLAFIAERPFVAIGMYVVLVVFSTWRFVKTQYWRRAIRIHPMCQHCRYSLRGLPARGRCPECGTSYGSSVQRVKD